MSHAQLRSKPNFVFVSVESVRVKLMSEAESSEKLQFPRRLSVTTPHELQMYSNIYLIIVPHKHVSNNVIRFIIMTTRYRSNIVLNYMLRIIILNFSQQDYT